MKAILLIAVFLISLGLPIHAQDRGFGALSWGDPPKPGMKLQDSRGRYKFYSDDLDKSNKDLIVNGIEELTYGFCKDKFCELLGRVRGKENFDKMFFGISAERGHPQINKHVAVWFAQTDVLIFFEEETDTGYFLFYNNPVHLAISKEQREHTKNEKETRYPHKKQWKTKAGRK
jgi:hypothetical protein